MQKEMSEVFQIIGTDRMLGILRAILIILAGLVVARLASSAILKVLKNRLAQHEGVLIRRGIFYGLSGLFFITGLHQMGFNLGVLLGAAGILSVAIGFASQTSASNLISGLFLLVERPFSLGDMIRVEDITGEVLSVDLPDFGMREPLVEWNGRGFAGAVANIRRILPQDNDTEAFFLALVRRPVETR